MSDKIEQIDRKIGLITAMMLAVAIVAIAWCAYQSALWHTIETFKLRDVTSDVMNYVLKELQQGQRNIIGVETFTQYANALIRKEQNLRDFYYERFRPDLKVAVDAWLKTDPLNNPNAPPTPFAMKEFNTTFTLEAEQFAKDSQLKLDEAHQAAKNSDDYIMLTVVYSAVLFTGAILEKMLHRQGRLILLIVALSITSVATSILVFMPITA